MHSNGQHPAARTPPYAAPPRPHNEQGEARKVGLELEIGRLSLTQTLQIIQRLLGGAIEVDGHTEGSVVDTCLGTFHVEFDHSLLKKRAYLRPLEQLGLIDDENSPAARRVEESVLYVASELVPVEVVTPPIPWTRLHELDPLWAALREAGAADTHGSPLYAFGLHLNPEVPDLRTATLLAFLRAYLVLEDWLVEASPIEMSRRISPFLRPFPEGYRRQVLDPDYAPSDVGFVEDYLTHNPTRNRPLDLCPLFVHLHGTQILSRIEEAHLVKGRPTFHHRLPNCEIAVPGWTPAPDWNRWVAVERLAADPLLLAELSIAYLATYALPLRLQSGGWIAQLKQRLGSSALTP